MTENVSFIFVIAQINSVTYKLEEESISNLQFQTPVSIHFPKTASCIESGENNAKIFWEGKRSK